MTLLVPEYRGVFTLFFNGLVSSNTPYLKAWKMRVRRILNGWDGGTCWFPQYAAIPMSTGQSGVGVNDIVAMNGAHIIYECATNRLWGRGLDSSMIDLVAFELAAVTLFNENFGLCLQWSRTDTLDAFVQMVVSHIGAACYIDRSTGLFTLKLIRGDYDPSVLPLYDSNSGLLDVTDDESASTPSGANEIIVKYHDPVMDVPRQTRAHNLASIQTNGEINSQTNDYEGIPTPYLAAIVALRDLKVQASALKRFTIKLDRRGWGVQPASVIRISAPDRGLSNIILRVGKVEDGTAGPTDGTISFVCLQDVFGLPETGFVSFQATGWVPPDNVPAATMRHSLTEATYRDLVHNLTPANLASQDSNSGAIMCLAGRPNQTSASYWLTTKAAGESYVEQTLGPWCATGRLTADIGPYDTTCTIDRGSDWYAAEVGGAVLIGSEWLQVTAFNTSTGVLTIVRGCIDTLPIGHPAGTFCFFADGREVSDGREYVSGEVISAKVLSKTSTAVLPLASADEDTLTIARRHFRPYPPGNVRWDGVRFLEINPIGVPAMDHVLTWAHRDRLTQADILYGHSHASIGPETGTTYEVYVYSKDGTTLLRTVTGLTGTSWTYTRVMQGADAAGDHGWIVFNSRRDGLVSFQAYKFRVPLLDAGFGYGWGFSWGELP